MALKKKVKKSIIQQYQLHDGDDGSPSVQIALLSEKIRLLSDHLKTNKKDNHSRRGLIRMVGQRRRLLQYLQETDEKQYKKVVKLLELD